MSHWQTDKLINSLLKIEGVAYINKSLPHGNIDTTNLDIYATSSIHILYVAGCNLAHEIDNPDDCEVDFVEVSDGHASCGGLNIHNDLDFGYLFIRICNALDQMGFKIVNCMDEYY